MTESERLARAIEALKEIRDVVEDGPVALVRMVDQTAEIVDETLAEIDPEDSEGICGICGQHVTGASDAKRKRVVRCAKHMPTPNPFCSSEERP